MFPDWDSTLICGFLLSGLFMVDHCTCSRCSLFPWRGNILHFVQTLVPMAYAQMWWDDAWTVLALLADVACLIVALIEQPIPHDPLPRFFDTGNWIFSFAYPVLMWSTRVSILVSIVRVSSPEGMLRGIALSIGTSFGLMCTAVLAFRLRVCIVNACLMTRPLLITHTVMTAECIADLLLSVLPLWFLRSLNLSRQGKTLLFSTFMATVVINIVTVVEAVVLLRSHLTSGSIIFEHVKVACSLIMCNLLVIDTFIYRILYTNETGMADSILQTNRAELTTIELGQIELSQDGSMTAGTTKSSSWSFRGSRPTVSGSASGTNACPGEE